MIDTNDPVVVQCIENFPETTGVSKLLYGFVNYTIQQDLKKGVANIQLQYGDTLGNKIDEDIMLRLGQIQQNIVDVLQQQIDQSTSQQSNSTLNDTNKQNATSNETDTDLITAQIESID